LRKVCGWRCAAFFKLEALQQIHISALPWLKLIRDFYQKTEAALARLPPILPANHTKRRESGDRRVCEITLKTKQSDVSISWFVSFCVFSWFRFLRGNHQNTRKRHEPKRRESKNFEPTHHQIFASFRVIRRHLG